MKTRTPAILLISILITTSLMGCGNSSSDDKSNSKQNTDTTKSYGDTGGIILPITNKPVSLSVIVDTQASDIKNKQGARELEKRTGVTLEIQAYPTSTVYEKIRMKVASGDLPDLITNLTRPEINRLGSEGTVTPINKYANELPNFTKLFIKDNAWVMQTLTAEDDNLYFWPAYNSQRDVNHGFMYRKDIFDKIGLKEWNNDTEFYQTLKKLKETYPSSSPFTSKYKEKIFYEISYGWGIGSLGYPAYYNENEKKWKPSITSPEWKNMIDFLKKLYNDGLLDKEFLTTSAADFEAKMTDGRSFVCFDWIGRMSLYKNVAKNKIPDYDLRYANPIGTVGKIRYLNKIGLMGTAVKNNDKKEVAMKLLDYLASDSGSELYTVGIKDVTYRKDVNGNVTWPDFPADKLLSFNDMIDKYGIHLMGIYTRIHPDSVYFKYTPAEKEAQEKMLESNKIETSDPVLKFTDNENEIITNLILVLQKKAEEFSAEYVVNKAYGDQEWNDWVTEADKQGIQKLVDVYNAAQKRLDIKNQ